MVTNEAQARGLALLLNLSWDRLVAIGVLYGSLCFAGWMAGG